MEKHKHNIPTGQPKETQPNEIKCISSEIRTFGSVLVTFSDPLQFNGHCVGNGIPPCHHAMLRMVHVPRALGWLRSILREVLHDDSWQHFLVIGVSGSGTFRLILMLYTVNNCFLLTGARSKLQKWILLEFSHSMQDLIITLTRLPHSLNRLPLPWP